MSPICVEPEIETVAEVEPVPVVEEKSVQVESPEPEPERPGWKQRFRNLMITIFAGHEEFLGWTPD